MDIELSSKNSKPNGKLGLGCLVLFALPFAGFGAFGFFSGVKKLVSGDLKNGLALTLFGCIFSLVGFGLIAGVFFGSKRLKREDARKQAHPNEPWLWREDWASGRIQSSTRNIMVFTWCFAGVWNGISSFVFFQIPSEIHKGNHLAAIAFLFPIIGIGLLIWAIRATLQWKKFGQSWFQLTTNPGTIGGQLAGHIETSVKIRPQEGYHLSLRCVVISSNGDSKSERISWEDEKVITKDALDDPRKSRIPVFFEIPADCSASDDGFRSDIRTVWRLKATVKVNGPDYSAIFEVPVFRTADSPVKLSDPTQAYQAPAKPYQLPPESPIKLIALPNGATEFHFPAFRNKGPAFSLLLFTIIWTGAIWLMARRAPIIFPIVFGLFELVLLFGLFQAFLKSSRVTVDTQGLHSRQSWLFFRTRRNLTLNDIARIETKIGMTSGNSVYYDIKARTNNYRFHTLASSIKGKKEAEWLASEMENLLLSHTASPAQRGVSNPQPR
jgi:hypothetical protein